MTPEEAIALEPGTTPGPWAASHSEHGVSYLREEEWHDPIGTAEFGHVEAEYTPADANLIAAAPDMRATIAAQTWEWAREARFVGDDHWIGLAWRLSRAKAERDVWLGFIPKGAELEYRLTRRPVGRVEVVE